MNDDLRSLIDSLAPALAVAFLAAIALLRRGINYKALIAALQAGDIDAAIAALDIEPAAFNGYALERQSQFVKAGTQAAEALTADRAGALAKVGDQPTARAPGVGGSTPTAAPRDAGRGTPTPPSSGANPPPPAPPGDITLTAPGGGSITFRFDMQNPRAEARIRTEAASRVAGYVDEQIEAARKVIADGFSRGEGPQSIATDIAGRINPISGKREGGIIGLSSPQVGYVDSMKRRLLSGDADEMVKVLGQFDADGKWVPGTGMTLRDRRYDGKIKAAIKAVAQGKPNPLTEDQVAEMVAKYSDRLLKKRADDVARTETASGVEMARAEATKQAIDKAGLPDDSVTKRWIHSGGPHHARNWHLAMNNREVVGIDTPFHLPDGSLMLHPHDPDGGARNNVACRCTGQQDVNWAYGLV